MNPLNDAAVWKTLSSILDPETHLDIVAMGLIYGVEVDLNSRPQVKIQYTLTTPLCPLATTIQSNIRDGLQRAFPDFTVTTESVILELVFDPPWTRDRMSAEARAELGI